VAVQRRSELHRSRDDVAIGRAALFASVAFELYSELVPQRDSKFEPGLVEISLPRRRWRQHYSLNVVPKGRHQRLIYTDRPMSCGHKLRAGLFTSHGDVEHEAALGLTDGS
jgi:hypothetical protein